MRFTSAAFLAFAASAFAQTQGFDPLTTPTEDESIPAGQAYTINWQPGTYTTGTVTLSLLGGATPSTLLDLGSFASGIQNSVGTYTWVVDSSLGDAATYGIKITLDSNSTIFQYSFPFHITASAATTSSSSAVVVTTATGYPTSAPVVESSTVATYSAVEITSSSSSAAPTTVAVTTSAAATVVSSSASTFATVAPSGNGTYTASTTYGATTLTSATTKSSSSTSSSATATASVVTTNGAGRAAAGSFALVAAVAAAFLL